MPAFVIAVIAAVGIAIGGAVVLGSMQKNAEVAFHSPSGVRL
jgi:hypothetical protein